MIIDDYGQRLFEMFSISEEQIDKVAAKIIEGKVLTVADRKLLYTLLSGDTEPDSLFPSRRGPKKQSQRDRKLAEEHEYLESLNTMSPKEIMTKLIEKHLKHCGDEMNGAYYKALRNGRIELELHREKMKNRIDRYQLLNKISK